MARPPSWLPRLHVIAKTVANSVRSHYDRHDLEKLFELQPRAAQNLLELLPSVKVGTAHLVEAEALATFLDGVRQADDTVAYFERVRLAKAAVSHRKNHSLVRRDIEPVSLTSLPDSITLAPGRLEVRFETIEQLAEAMYTLARVLQDEGDEFARTYESPLKRSQSERSAGDSV